ncbi:MAG: hypothetical protein F7C35_08950 [Desulfurococcales archaeon]|nr:hypothetical protein [Desulfurococcales archaeon]
MPGESPLDRLTKAVLKLDDDMVRLSDGAKSKAGELIRRADSLALELENDVKILLKELVEDLDRTVKEKSEELKKRYALEKDERLRDVRVNAELHMEEAVKTILDEITRILSEV